MRLLISTALLLAGCNSVQGLAQQPSIALHPGCDPEAVGALVAKKTAANARSPATVDVRNKTLHLVEAKYVQGLCVKNLIRFNSGHAFLSSGEFFLIRNDGHTELRPPNSLPEQNELPARRIADLSGYQLVMAERIWNSPNAVSEKSVFVGLLRSKSDYVIARFGLEKGRAIGKSEVLIRSRLPIVSVDYLPAPDTPEGRIGFIQRVGANQAWLLSYDWNHGDLAQQ